jgi:di/tricarboxylate transporter
MQRSEQGLDKKHIIGIIIILIYAIVIFTLLILADKQLAPILTSVTLIMLAVYVLLAFEIIHRSILAILGAVLAIASAIFFGSISAEGSLDFIIESTDFNTI